MTKIFKNMAPYWYMIVAIVLLLIVQAFGDLSLPQYTSDIIDVGIQNKGVEHILPVKMTEDEYEISQLYMTSKEKRIWKDTYGWNFLINVIIALIIAAKFGKNDTKK